MAEIKVVDLVKHYVQKKTIDHNGVKARRQVVKAVDGVTFTLAPGEILGIIGESGCGKSTLGRVLVDLEEPTSGQITIDGVSTREILRKDRLAFRRQAQIVFQNPFDSFDPRHTIRRVLMDVLKLHRIGRDDEERLKIILDRMEDAGLHPAADYLDRYPFELSGGQLQRISILRSMLLDPKFLVADEPVSMLDVSVRADIINMLLRLVREKGTSMVFISHDIATTRYISDRVAVMYLGRIVELGRTDDILHDPQHPYTQALIANCASLDPNEKRQRIALPGEPPTPIGTGPGCYFAPRCRFATDRCRKEYPPACIAPNGCAVTCFRHEKKEGQ